MKIQSVKDAAFATYGRIVDEYDFGGLIDVLNKTTDATDKVVYEPSVAQLEATESFQLLQDNVYGGMPIQIGYCNGTNSKLNCVEYHRDSEIDIAADDVVLLLARQQDINGDELDTSKVEAFFCPAGTAVELYATTLHYAPCSAKKNATFRVVIVLPKGTNTNKPAIKNINSEDKKLFARNKWLIAHPEAPEASQGAVVGLKGTNIDLY